MESDTQLVARVRSGDIEAFGALMARYERTLMAYAVGKLHDLHAAEDVVQSTALLAFRRLEALRDDNKFGNWLIRICQTQVIETVRTRKVLTNVSPDATEHRVMLHAGDQLWIENEYLLELVALLSDDEQLLIGMRYFEGQSMAEIAAYCSRPIGSVTKQLSRAIARLRSLIAEENRE